MADKKKIKKGKVVILSGEGFTVLGSEKFKKQKRQEKLDYDLEKQGYNPTEETQAKSKVSTFDSAGRIRSGLAGGGISQRGLGRAFQKGGKV